MKEREWQDTPYANTDAKDTDKNIDWLMEKYGVQERQWTQTRGPNGRPAFMLRFNLRDRTYRIALEVLDAPQVEMSKRIKQIKRVIYWTLKNALETTQVFFTPEEALFAFLELPDGPTLYEAGLPHVNKLKAADFGVMLRQHFPMLPAPEEHQ